MIAKVTESAGTLTEIGVCAWSWQMPKTERRSARICFMIDLLYSKNTFSKMNFGEQFIKVNG
jgi:hypothetical protein